MTSHVRARFPAFAPVTKRQLERIERWLDQTPTAARYAMPGGQTENIVLRMQRENAEVEAAYIRSCLGHIAGRPSRDLRASG